VIKWEKRVLIVHYLEQGLPVAAIARELGVDRRTVHRWKAAGELQPDAETGLLPRKDRRAPQPCKLDPYKGIIRTRLEAYPELSAVRLFDEVKAAGYTGGLTQLKVFVQEVRPRCPGSPSFTQLGDT